MGLIVRILFLAMILSLITLFLGSFTPISPLLVNYSWYNIIFFTALTLGTGMLGHMGLSSKNNQTFLLAVLGGFLLKLVVAAGFVLVLKFAVDLEPKLFFAPFATCYILFTAIETVFLLRLNMKANAEQGKKG